MVNSRNSTSRMGGGEGRSSTFNDRSLLIQKFCIQSIYIQRYSMSHEVNCVGNMISGDSSVPVEGGFVKDAVTYMVTDNLVIQPMYTITSITLLNKFNVEEVGVLQEKVVELGMTQAVDLLETSLQSKAVLTSVFLKKNVQVEL